MTILYVDTVGSWGGVATYLRPLLKDQVKRDNKVYLLVGTKGELTKWTSNKLPEVNIIILSTLKRNIHIFDTLKAIYQFRKIVKKINPNIIHLNCIMSGIVGRLGSIGLPSKIIYNAHGWAFEPGTNKRFKWPSIIIEKILAYFTDKIICVSDYEYRIASKYHIFKNKRQSIVIKNASPDIHMLPSDKLNDNIFRITMAARFFSQKDQGDLLKAFELLDHKLLKSKTLKLYLLGNGPNLNKCKQMSRDLNISNDVIFTGEVNNVFEYYNQSNIVTLITHYDAISISLIEALSMGKPIIASDVSGVPENFYHNGYCVSNQPKIIAYDLLKLYKNKRLRIIMGRNSRNLYKREFVLSKNIKRHNLLYLELMRSEFN